jgi:hypothetical protein
MAIAVDLLCAAWPYGWGTLSAGKRGGLKIASLTNIGDLGDTA